MKEGSHFTQYIQRNRERQNEETEEYIPNQQQGKSSEKDLNETEISNTLNKEFIVMAIKRLTDLRRRIDEHSKNFCRELGTR